LTIIIGVSVTVCLLVAISVAIICGKFCRARKEPVIVFLPVPQNQN
jgi:hypothetical protein